MQTAKAHLRARIRAARRARVAHGPALRAADAAALAAGVHSQAPAGTLAAYVAMASEPPTDAILAAGPPLLLPRVSATADGEPALEWIRYFPGDPLHRSALGIDEPDGPGIGSNAEPLAQCALVVIPSLAVDGTGRRLGQGGGYYDRVIGELGLRDTRPLIVTLLYDDEVLDDVAAEPHDCRVDVVVTPTRSIDFRR